jgi:hypothetical protein
MMPQLHQVSKNGAGANVHEHSTASNCWVPNRYSTLQKQKKTQWVAGYRYTTLQNQQLQGVAEASRQNSTAAAAMAAE